MATINGRPDILVPVGDRVRPIAAEIGLVFGPNIVTCLIRGGRRYFLRSIGCVHLHSVRTEHPQLRVAAESVWALGAYECDIAKTKVEI